MKLISFRKNSFSGFLSKGLSRPLLTQVFYTRRVTLTALFAMLTLQGCNELTSALSDGTSNTSTSSSNFSHYFSIFNSEVVLSNPLLTVGGKTTVTLFLRDDAGNLVVSRAPKVYFYYYGGTSQGYFDNWVDHFDGTYSAVFTALSAGSDLTIHLRVDDQEIVTVAGLPTIKIPGGLAQSITILSGGAQSGRSTAQLPVPFSVQIKDASGTVLPGAQVSWRVTGGGGTVSLSTTTTNGSGITSSQLTLGPRAGTNNVVATASGTQLTANFSAIATSTAFNQSWVYSSTMAPNFDYDPTKIYFNPVTNACELYLRDHIDQNDNSAGFGGGSKQGLVWDSTGQYLRLGTSGACDGTSTNCSELASSWTPQWSSLQGYWKLNEASAGSVLDSSGKGHLGSPLSVSFGNVGKLGLAAGFDGSSSSIDVGQLNFTDNVTIALWVKPSASQTSNADILSNYSASNAGYTLERHSATSNGYYFAWANGSTYTCALQSNTVQLTANVWQHLVVIKSGVQVTYYLNGQAAGGCTGAFPNIASSAETLKLGRSGIFSGRNFAGQVDDLAMWNSSLSTAEAQLLYSRQSAKYSGSITSRIMDAGAAQAWTTLAWVPTLPFSKPLPDAGVSEVAAVYPAIPTDNLMTGLQGLWHFNEIAAGTAPGGKDYIDSSGNGKHGTKSAAPTYGAKGVFNRAINTNGQGITMPVAIGTTVTISLWTSISPGNIGNNPMLWRTGPNGQGPDLFFSGGVISLNTWDSSNNPYSAIPSAASDGRMHHWAIVIDAANPKSDLYFDGVKLGQANYRNPTASSISFSSNVGSYEWNGIMDEAAVWSRALTLPEIKQLYRRGVNNIRFQMRTCTTATCSDDASGVKWKGSNGTPSTFISEFNNNTFEEDASGAAQATAPLMTLAHYTNPPANAQYFQYRAFLESDDLGSSCNYGAGNTSCSPELKSVTVGPSGFDTSAPSVISKVGVNYLYLAGFAENLGAACTFGVGYNIGVGADSSTALWYYWASAKGADCSTLGTGAWCPSDGTVVQSSSASDVSSHATTFAAKVGTGTAYVKSYLKSSGATNCSLYQVDLNGEN